MPPEQVADIVAWLAGRESGSTTGNRIAVDAGAFECRERADRGDKRGRRRFSDPGTGRNELPFEFGGCRREL